VASVFVHCLNANRGASVPQPFRPGKIHSMAEMPWLYSLRAPELEAQIAKAQIEILMFL